MHSRHPISVRGYLHARITHRQPATAPVEINTPFLLVVDPIGGGVRLRAGDRQLTLCNPECAARIRAFLLDVDPPAAPVRPARADRD